MPCLAVYGERRVRTVADAANCERMMRGLPLLRWDDGLAAAAREHAALMARKKALSHQFGGERDLAGRVVAAGATFTALAENVVLGPTAGGLHSQWMKSPPHRRNLLDAEFTRPRGLPSNHKPTYRELSCRYHQNTSSLRESANWDGNSLLFSNASIGRYAFPRLPASRAE